MYFGHPLRAGAPDIRCMPPIARKQGSDKCRMCGQQKEPLGHVMGGYPLSNGRSHRRSSLWRHQGKAKRKSFLNSIQASQECAQAHCYYVFHTCMCLIIATLKSNVKSNWTLCKPCWIYMNMPNWTEIKKMNSVRVHFPSMFDYLLTIAQDLNTESCDWTLYKHKISRLRHKASYMLLPCPFLSSSCRED